LSAGSLRSCRAPILAAGLALLALGGPVGAQLLDEGFESVAALEGLGWALIKHIAPPPVP